MNIFESVKKNSAYMLRSDGEYFLVNIHPQLLSFYEIASNSYDLDDLRRTLFWITDNKETDLHWIYTHTNDAQTKQYILDVVSFGAQLLKQDVPEFNINYSSSDATEYDLSYVKTLVYLIQLQLNQEFCKVRLSDKYRQVHYPKADVYFRITSINLDWYDILWKFIFDNKSYIDTVTIETDAEAKGNEKLYSYQGTKIDHMNINDFLTIEHAPIIESFGSHRVLNALSHGTSISESCGNVNPYRIFMYIITAFEKFNCCKLNMFTKDE